MAITEFIEDNIQISNILKLSAPIWDGGYCVMGATGSGETFALRDPWGIRPCFWYMNDEILVIASERPVIQTTLDLEIHEVNELSPGCAITMNKGGELKIEKILQPKTFAACSFERVYFSRGSDCDIYQERKKLGKSLVPQVLEAINNEVDDTVFSYIPNTAEAAYYGMIEGFNEYLNEEKIAEIEKLGNNVTSADLRKILNRRLRSEKVAWKDIKMRTFIAESNSRNDLAAHVYDITYGSLRKGIDNLVIIDDSIVRGTTLRESIIRILDRLHPKRIVIVSSSPQVRFPDFYGIDMSNMDEFIAFKAVIALLKETNQEHRIKDIYTKCKAQSSLSKEEMVNYVSRIYDGFTTANINKKMAEMLRPEGVEAEIKIVYQTLEGLHNACPTSPGDWYFSGNYPTPGGVKCVNEAFINFYENKYKK